MYVWIVYLVSYKFLFSSFSFSRSIFIHNCLYYTRTSRCLAASRAKKTLSRVTIISYFKNHGPTCVSTSFSSRRNHTVIV